jgi:lysophospholipase L1-like esterase
MIAHNRMLRTPHRRFLFALFCGFSWLTISVAIAKEPAAPAAKQPAGSARFESEIVAFEKWDHQNAVPTDCILFVGSSSIRLWQTADAFPGLPVINRGFGGSTIADVNHFADRIVFKYHPRTIVFYAGDNDIAGGHSPERVVDDYKAFAKSVHERLPNTQLIYLTIKPSPQRWKMWSKSQTVNAHIQELTKKNEHDLYIDAGTPILGDNGEPRKELFRDDGLHMSTKGYAIWNEILRPLLTSSPSGKRPG